MMLDLGILCLMVLRRCGKLGEKQKGSAIVIVFQLWKIGYKVA